MIKQMQRLCQYINIKELLGEKLEWESPHKRTAPFEGRHTFQMKN